MTAERTTLITCDAPNCDQTRYGPGNFNLARETAAKDGWFFHQGNGKESPTVDYCPKHRIFAAYI